MIYYEKGDIVIRDSEKEDIPPLANDMRKEDSEEVWASSHMTPEVVFNVSFNISPICLTFLFRGEPIAMFGVNPDSLLSTSGVVWLLTTNKINQVKFRFLKLSRMFIQFFLRKYPHLYNFVDARHKLAVEWLKWCGAKLSDAQPFGIENKPFHYFVLEESKYV